MRGFVLIAFLLAAWPVSSKAAIKVAQSCKSQDPSLSNLQCVLPNVQAGSFVVAFTWVYGSGTISATGPAAMTNGNCSQNFGANHSGALNDNILLCLSQVAASTGTETVQIHNNNGGGVAIIAAEICNISSATVDGTGSNAIGSAPGGANSTGSFATANASDLLIAGGWSGWGTAGSLSAGAGYALIDTQCFTLPGPLSFCTLLEYKTVSSTGTYDATIVQGGSSPFENAVYAATQGTSSCGAVRHRAQVIPAPPQTAIRKDSCRAGFRNGR